LSASAVPFLLVIVRTQKRKAVIISAEMTWFGVASRTGEQPKERWFSNHRPQPARRSRQTSWRCICVDASASAPICKTRGSYPRF